MTVSKSKTSRPKAKAGTTEPVMVVVQNKGDSDGKALARGILGEAFRHGNTASAFAGCLLGSSVNKPGVMEYAEVVKEGMQKAEAGDLGMASRMLAAQAITLDSMFTELARRSAHNMGEYIGASEKYGRLALKAQSNCRATLEALAKLHQPREQTVRHVHVNEGGQAVIADQFHHHTGGMENGKISEQPHATGTAGGAAGIGPALPSPDPLGNGVPLPSREGQATVQDAWRQG
jgi:hypothetical protein